jgi:hypothetical protein
MPAGFKSEWWPGSNRNGGRLHVGIPGRNESECLRVQIGPGATRGGRDWSTDLFEAGLNEAASSLAQTYGRSMRRCVVGRAAEQECGGNGWAWRHCGRRPSVMPQGMEGAAAGVSRRLRYTGKDKTRNGACAGIARPAWKRAAGLLHELSHRGGACRDGAWRGQEPTSTMWPPQQGQTSSRRPVRIA